MPKYLIERDMPGAHKLSEEQLREAARKSRDVLDHLGTGIQWQRSYVTEDRITCIYIAEDEEIIRKHARIGKIPADRIHEIKTIIDPTTAEPKKVKVGA